MIASFSLLGAAVEAQCLSVLENRHYHEVSSVFCLARSMCLSSLVLSCGRNACVNRDEMGGGGGGAESFFFFG
jgi:hypothetical protein